MSDAQYALRSLRQRTNLLHEGQHVEVVSALLDLSALEVQHPARARGLLLPGRRQRALRTFEGSRMRSLPGHFEDDGVARGERIRHGTLDVRHGRLPLL